MFEGSPTTRFQQILAGIALGVCALSAFIIGGFGGWRTYERGIWNATAIIVIGAFFIVGVGGTMVAYRLITARGVRQGGGLLSPNSYRILGWAFVALSIFLGYVSIRDRHWKDLLVSLFPLIFAGWCFIAARFRGAMRKTPEWQNKR
jgi:hypothetical protein